MRVTLARPDFSRIKAVFFDAGGTLFQPHPSVGEIYAEVALKFGLAVDPKKIEELFHDLWEKRDGLAGLSSHSSEKVEREWWRSLVGEVFSKFGTIERFDEFFTELYDRFARPESWRIFPDVLSVFEVLKRQGKILGIISNWDSRLFSICEGLGLEPYLDFILASAVVGAAKPSPKIFKEAIQRARVSPEEALHIGDSLEDDILGAQRSGIQTVFLNRKGSRTSESFTISTLHELMEPLQSS